MMILAAAADKMGIADAGIVAALGYGVVFFGLILLMIVVSILGKIFTAADKKAKAASRTGVKVNAKGEKVRYFKKSGEEIKEAKK